MEENFVSLESLGQGAAVELFQEALADVLNNILDPNTKAATARAVTLTVTFKPDEDRTFANAVIDVKAKLAPAKGVGTAVYIGRHAGMPVATERDVRQLRFDDNVAPMKEANNAS